MTYAEVLAEAEVMLTESVPLVLAAFIVFGARLILGMARGVLD